MVVMVVVMVMIIVTGICEIRGMRRRSKGISKIIQIRTWFRWRNWRQIIVVCVIGGGGGGDGACGYGSGCGSVKCKKWRRIIKIIFVCHRKRFDELIFGIVDIDVIRIVISHKFSLNFFWRVAWLWNRTWATKS